MNILPSNIVSHTTNPLPEERPQGVLQGHTVSKDFVVIPPPGQPVTGASFIEKRLEGLFFTVARFLPLNKKTLFNCFHLLPHMNSEPTPQSKPYVRQAKMLARSFINATPDAYIG